MDVRMDLEKPSIFYLKSIHNEMIKLKRRIDVADFRFAMLLWDYHKQVRYCYASLRVRVEHSQCLSGRIKATKSPYSSSSLCLCKGGSQINLQTKSCMVG